MAGKSASRSTNEARLYHAVRARLAATSTGDPMDIVLAAVTDEKIDILEATMRTLSTELSERSGMPAAALRTRAGWTALLRAEGLVGRGETVDPTETIDTLPGTLTVLALRDLIRTSADLERVASVRTRQQLERLWEKTKSAGKHFDEVITETGQHNNLVAEIGWSFISLEGRRHVNLVWHQANKLQRSYPDRDADDLLAWGWLGLRTALRHYNPELGFAFSTYAVTRIVGSIRDGVRAENPVPKRLLTQARAVAAVEAELANSLGRAPTFNEISNYLNIEAAHLAVIKRTRTPASIEEIVGGIERNGSIEPGWLADGALTDEQVLGHIDAQRVTEALQALPPDEAEAVRLLIMEARNPSEARQMAGTSARQLRQRKERALQTLRQSLSDLDPSNT